MKIFTKKGILQKTILVILAVLCINFIVPTYSQASLGGVLFKPFQDLGTLLGDTIEGILQAFMLGRGFEWQDIVVPNNDEKVEKMKTTKQEDIDRVAFTVNKDDLDLYGIDLFGGSYRVPVIDYTPEEIFSNKVPYLDINFINPKFTKNDSTGVEGTASILRDTISGWYIALRNLSIVGLLCVLVYVGIRIILSSTAAEKAKHKQMFMDWVIALCLLFFLHYIMSFTLVMIDAVNDSLVGGGTTAESLVVGVEDGGTTTYYNMNLLSATRLMVESKSVSISFGYLIMYMALVAYTAVFTYHYLKRLLIMAFLTIIAPLVALTYPIDKMGDGKAQAFNMWLKEYVYNALIQPFHLIIYMVFVGTAMELIKVNMIFGLAAIAFILPAEKLLKKMFGFDRAPLGAMGAIAGYTAGSIASKFRKGGSKPVQGNKGGNDNAAQNANDKPKYTKTHGIDGIEYPGNGELETPGSQMNLPEGQVEGKQNPEDTAIRTSEKFAEEERKQEELARQKQLEEQQIMQEQQAQEQQRKFGQQEQEQQAKQQEGSNQNKAPGRFRQGMRNIINEHGGTKAVTIKGAKTLARAAKFTARNAIKATGIIAGAGAGLASGQGIAGVIAGASAGKSIGDRVGNMVANAPGNVAGKIKHAGSVIRREKDVFNGDSNAQDNYNTRMFMKDTATDQYIRDKLTNENDGIAPTDRQIEAEKEGMKDYLDEGIYDVAEIYRAKKAEKLVGSRQAAKIAQLANERGIDSKVLGDDKQYAQRRKDFTQEFMDKRGMSEREATRMSDYVLNTMKVQKGQSYDKNAIRGLGDSKYASNTTKETNNNTKSLNSGTNAAGSSTNRNSTNGEGAKG